MRFAQVQGGKVQDRRLFVDRAAVGQHRFGVHLQVHIIVKTQRLDQADQGMKLGTGGVHALLGTRVGRDNHRQAVVFGHAVEHGHQFGERLFGFDVFFAVSADHKVLTRRQLQTRNSIRRLNLRQVVVQDLKHGAAGFDDLVGWQTLTQQIVTCDGAVGEVDVRRVVHDAPVRLFGHTLIKATVTGFHVEDRHLAALGGYHRQTAVGVAQHQHGFGFLFGQHTIHRGDQVADRVGRTGAAFGAVQKVVRLSNTQVVKEHLVEFVVVVLPSVDQDMVAMHIQGGEHAGQTDDLGAGAHDRHDFEFFHGFKPGWRSCLGWHDQKFRWPTTSPPSHQRRCW